MRWASPQAAYSPVEMTKYSFKLAAYALSTEWSILRILCDSLSATDLSTLPMLTNSLFMKTLGGNCIRHHFTDEATEA